MPGGADTDALRLRTMIPNRLFERFSNDGGQRCATLSSNDTQLMK
jgi:hypothetical protein